MIIALLDTDKDFTLINKIKKILDELHLNYFLTKEQDYNITKADLILIPGGDRSILDYFYNASSNSPPVVGVYEAESTGFLTQIDIRELEADLSKIKKGDYKIDEVIRLAVKVDGKDIQPVLNDVAVFPSKSATLMEHVLKINDKDIWHDNSDGVIISSPIGSTAYSMSAGGPMILEKSAVLEIVSVNSLDNTRRPLIVPDSSIIEISEIMSRYHCEVIFDGIKRMPVKKFLECQKHEVPAKLVRLTNQDNTASILAKKVKLAEDLLNMPPSAKLILKTLEYEGALSQKDLYSKTMLPERTIRLSLSHLVEKGYVKKKISLRDARQRIYELKI